MNREQKKERRRELRRLERQREIEKNRIREEQEDPEEYDVIETSDPVDTQKDIYPAEAAPYDVLPAPISFEELDELEQAREDVEKELEVNYDTERLVRNILRNPEMETGEKVEAMIAVADGFGDRVESESEETEKEADLDLLQLEALIAHDRRSTNAQEFIGDIITKAVLSGARRDKMGDEKFALVTERDGVKVRKYPIHDKAHVRKALALSVQMIKRGGKSAADAKAALTKIRSAAKSMGIGNNMEKERNSILIEKDAEDHWRWVGWVSNNFIDWDGDIITEDAHKEYVGWLEKNMDVAPSFVSWHTPGTSRTNPVDFAMYENGFLIMSGLLEEQEAIGLLKAQSKVDLGMSHGTFVLSRDPKDPRAITKYRMYEASDLPLENAANPFTDFETMVKEVGMDKVKYLAQILGSEEKANAFLEKTGLKQKQLQEAEVESKEQVVETVETPAPPAPEEKQVNEEQPVDETVKPVLKAEDIVAQVMKEMDIDGLNTFVTQAKEAIEKVPVLEALIKDLQGEKEEKLAEMLKPPVSKFAWSQEKRASQSEDNVVSGEEKEKVKPGVPEGYWLSNITNSVPVKVE